MSWPSAELLAEIHAQPLEALQRSALFHELGDDLFMTLDDALDRARAYLETRTTGGHPVVESSASHEASR